MDNLGHSSIATTSIYLHSAKGDRLKALTQVFEQTKRLKKKAEG